jgi:hypothetical protein
MSKRILQISNEFLNILYKIDEALYKYGDKIF